MTLTLALSGLLSGRAEFGIESVLRYWRVGADGSLSGVEGWIAERVPATFDPSASELIAGLEHFSRYGVILLVASRNP